MQFKWAQLLMMMLSAFYNQTARTSTIMSILSGQKGVKDSLLKRDAENQFAEVSWLL